MCTKLTPNPSLINRHVSREFLTGYSDSHWSLLAVEFRRILGDNFSPLSWRNWGTVCKERERGDTDILKKTGTEFGVGEAARQRDTEILLGSWSHSHYWLRSQFRRVQFSSLSGLRDLLGNLGFKEPYWKMVPASCFQQPCFTSGPQQCPCRSSHLDSLRADYFAHFPFQFSTPRYLLSVHKLEYPGLTLWSECLSTGSVLCRIRGFHLQIPLHLCVLACKFSKERTDQSTWYRIQQAVKHSGGTGPRSQLSGI